MSTPEDRAIDPPVGNQHVGAQAQDIDGDLVVDAAPRGFLELLNTARPDKPARRAAELEPGVSRQRDVFLDEPVQASKGTCEAHRRSGQRGVLTKHGSVTFRPALRPHLFIF
jgi:hypothetical protein